MRTLFHRLLGPESQNPAASGFALGLLISVGELFVIWAFAWTCHFLAAALDWLPWAPGT